MMKDNPPEKEMSLAKASEKPKFLAFQSPKGGVGRTMLAANTTLLYATGCPEIGLEARTTLAIDAHIEAPGFHFYDFLDHFKKKESTGQGAYYQIGKKRFTTLEELNVEIANSSSLGVLYWSTSLTNDSSFKEECYRVARDYSDINDRNKVIFEKTNQLIRESLDLPDSSLNPFNHLIHVKDGTDKTKILLFPAADSQQVNYRETLFNFDWNAFFTQYYGVAAWDALHYSICKLIPKNDQYKEMFPQVARVILDQTAGEVWSSAINRVLATHQIHVCGTNLQNQAGLMGTIIDHENPKKVRIVLSEYDKNSSSTLENITTNLISKGVSSDHIYQLEHLSEAVNKEYLAPQDSKYYREIIRLVGSIEEEK